MRLYDEHAARKIVDGEILFRLNKELFVFRAANVQHAQRPLENGARVLCYFDREDMGWLHLTDGAGGYLGSIPRTRGARRSDKEAVKQQIDSQRKALRELQEKVSARMPQVAEQHLAELESNAAVLSEVVSGDESVQAVSSPKFAEEIGAVVQNEKLRLKSAVARKRALKNFRGEVGELVGNGETSKLQHPTSREHPRTNIQCADVERGQSLEELVGDGQRGTRKSGEQKMGNASPRFGDVAELADDEVKM
jgi:hypothetical protein